MKRITINLSDDDWAKVQEKGTRVGRSVAELVRINVEDLITQPDDAIEQAADYVLKKNAELYKRLS